MNPARRQEYEVREDALRDYRTLKESARREGEVKGKAELIEVVLKKLDKKKTVEEIADILEQDIEYIQTIADLREMHPDYSTIELAKELVANK